MDEVKDLPLSAATEERVELLFARSRVEEARCLLIQQCGNNLPFCENSTPVNMERIRFAVLKISNGNLVKLNEAIELAKIDWRDALVAAGFANDVNIHKKWIPKKR